METAGVIGWVTRCGPAASDSMKPRHRPCQTESRLAACTARCVSKLSMARRRVFVVTQGGPLVLGRDRLPHADCGRELPFCGAYPAWRMVAHDLLEPPTHNLCEAHLILASQPLRLMVELIGDLNVSFYRDRKLPASFGAASLSQRATYPALAHDSSIGRMAGSTPEALRAAWGWQTSSRDSSAARQRLSHVAKPRTVCSVFVHGR